MRGLWLALLGLLIVNAAVAETPAPSEKKPEKLQVKITSNDPINVFYADDLRSAQKSVTLSIEATNISGSPVNVRYRWQLADFHGKTLKSGSLERRNLAPTDVDRWYVAFHLDPELKGNGYFHFVLHTSAAGESRDWDAAFIVVPRPAPGTREDSMFAIAASPDDQGFLAMQRIGARWLRTDAGCNWMTCEPTKKGEFNWAPFDRLLEQCKAHDLLLLPIMDYAPDWAKAKGPDGKPFQYLDAPENVQDYADFVAAAVARYAKDVKYYELWNEPYVMGWTWHSTAQHYRDMLKATYPAAKAANPNCVLIASGGSASHLQDVVFAKNASVADCLDETSTHTYGVGGPEDDFLGKAEHSVLVSKHNGKNVCWDTEQGWQLWDSPDMAKYVPRTYVLAKLAGIRTLAWFTLASDDMGLFKPGYVPRAAAAAYAVCASMLEDTVLVQDLYPYSRRIWGAVFKNKEGRKVAVVWSVGDSGTIRICADQGVSAYDMMGNPVGRVERNVLTAPLSDEVLYLVTNGDQDVFLRNLEMADISGITPVTMTVKPFLAPISQSPPIRVEVTNELNVPVSGDLQVRPPKEWTLSKNRVDFGPLEPGATTVVSFPVSQAVVAPDNRYEVTVLAAKKLTDLPWQVGWNTRFTQTVSVAAAVRGTPRIDGDLSDWTDALPLPLNTKEAVSPYAPEAFKKAWTPGNVSAVAYVMWDDQNVYFAAKVTDNFHSQQSSAENPYAFPFDGDSIQLALGVDAQDPNKLKSPTSPSYRRGLVFDTDYECALSLTPKGPEFYVLHTPETGYQTYYPTNPDIGLGLYKDINLAVVRDDIKETTTYEVAIPWSLMPQVDRTKPVRFGFIVNDRDRGNSKEGWLEWPAMAGVKKGNELSFSPTWVFTTANLAEFAFVDSAK